MDLRSYLSSEDYIFEIKNNEQLFESKKLACNIKPIWSFKGHNNSIEGIHLIDDDTYATVSHDCFVSVWDISNNKNIRNIELGHPILCSSYYSKRKYLSVGMTNKDNNIHIIDMENKKNIDNLCTKCNSIFCMNYFDDDKITYGSKDGSICLTDLNKKKNIYRYEEIGDCLNFCTFNTNYKIHLFSTYKGNILFFDFRYALPVQKNNQLHSLYSINTIYSDNNYLYSGASDCLIKKFDLRLLDENKPVEIYIGHTSPIRFLTFSNKYKNYFCSSSDNGSIKLWKEDNYRNIGEVKKFNTSLVYDSIPSVFPPLLGDLTTKTVGNGHRKISKNFLELNKKTVSSNRSNSIVSECNYKESHDLFRNKNNSKKYGIFGKISILDKNKKRTLTPNIPNVQEKKVPVVSRNELFNIIRSKGEDKNSEEGLNHSTKNISTKNGGKKNMGTKNIGTKNIGTKNIGTKYIGTKNIDTKNIDTKNIRSTNKLGLPESSYYFTTPKINSIQNNLKTKGRTNLNISNDRDKRDTTTNLPMRVSNLTIPELFGEEENSLIHNSAKKIKIKYSTLSMLNHRSRVSSMVWLDDLVLSTSWDQNIKCWNIGRYVME
ncbi:WD repeat-containing protein, putative [Plasmodium malariae]|uniref:WD repeat-containing protein, putative n=1 Tax=Plasmodium malariae TaxID=5858 RepID=A0A1C3KCA4_PLAMA|nr:WD repeat-containing protein, putative [Plasmodium malariae]